MPPGKDDVFAAADVTTFIEDVLNQRPGCRSFRQRHADRLPAVARKDSPTGARRMAPDQLSAHALPYRIHAVDCTELLEGPAREPVEHQVAGLREEPETLPCLPLADEKRGTVACPRAGEKVPAIRPDRSEHRDRCNACWPLCHGASCCGTPTTTIPFEEAPRPGVRVQVV